MGTEIDVIAHRLNSLKEIHQNSLHLPKVLAETQSMMQFMEESLNEEVEILEMLEKGVEENAREMRENLEVLRKGM